MLCAVCSMLNFMNCNATQLPMQVFQVRKLTHMSKLIVFRIQELGSAFAEGLHTVNGF